jgi:hypothetical protein
MIGLDPVSHRLVPLSERERPELWKIRLWRACEMTESRSIVPVERIEKHIHFIRGQKVMLDADLAEMYGVVTGHLNRAVQRNADRFPDDFMFQLTTEETTHLKSQIGISSQHGGRRRSRPYAFTEQGVAMSPACSRASAPCR